MNRKSIVFNLPAYSLVTYPEAWRPIIAEDIVGVSFPPSTVPNINIRIDSERNAIVFRTSSQIIFSFENGLSSYLVSGDTLTLTFGAPNNANEY